MLDVACGPGTNALHFAHADYVGVDLNERYIEHEGVRPAAEYSIDLLITDLELDGMTGAEVALEAHMRIPRLPVLFISGVFPDPGMVEHFLAKPFSVDDLVRKVAAMLEQAEGFREEAGS